MLTLPRTRTDRRLTEVERLALDKAFAALEAGASLPEGDATMRRFLACARRHPSSGPASWR
jgi:hypothetical protein